MIFQDKNYTTYVGDNISFDDQRSPLQNNAEFKRALTVHEIQNDVTIYKIHRYFFFLFQEMLQVVFADKRKWYKMYNCYCRYYCQEELKLVRELIEKEKENIIKIAPKTPGGNASLTWPIGMLTKLMSSNH